MAGEKKYHVNPETGRPNLCTATGARGCQYAVDGQEPQHYTDKAEAKAAGDAMMKERHKDNPFGTMSKKPKEEAATQESTATETPEEAAAEPVDLAEIPADAVAMPVEDPDAVKVSPKERAAFQNVMDYDGDTEVNQLDQDALDDAFLNAIGYETEEATVPTWDGDEEVVDIPTGDVHDISKHALVDAYYREAGKRMANPEEEQAAKRVIARVFEKHDMFESYNYTPVIEGDVDDVDEPPYVAAFACHADTEAMLRELKGIFNG